MLTRKPQKGEKLEHVKGWFYGDKPEWVDMGIVKHCKGNICHYDRSDGRGEDSFIWFFAREKTHNILVRVAS